MARGSKCPICSESTLHDQGTHYECSACAARAFEAEVKNVGSGKGCKCKACENFTLHEVKTNKGSAFYCSTCKILIC